MKSFFIILLFSITFCSTAQETGTIKVRKSGQELVQNMLYPGNVLYMCIENPLEILIKGGPIKKIRLATDNGKILKKGGLFYAVADTSGKANITVYEILEGSGQDLSTTVLGEQEFSVSDLPPAVPTLAGKHGGKISLKTLLENDEIKAVITKNELNIPLVVVGYKIEIISKGKKATATVTGNSMPSEIKKAIKKMNRGDTLCITNITTRQPDGKTVNAGSLIFEIE